MDDEWEDATCYPKEKHIKSLERKTIDYWQMVGIARMIAWSYESAKGSCSTKNGVGFKEERRCKGVDGSGKLCEGLTHPNLVYPFPYTLILVGTQRFILNEVSEDRALLGKLKDVGRGRCRIEVACQEDVCPRE